MRWNVRVSVGALVLLAACSQPVPAADAGGDAATLDAPQSADAVASVDAAGEDDAAASNDAAFVDSPGSDAGPRCSGPADCAAGPHQTSACVDSRCVMACETSWDDCDGAAAGCETPITTARDCGRCGNTCPSGEACTLGECNAIGPSWAAAVPSIGTTRLYSGVFVSDSLVVAGEMYGTLTMGGVTIPGAGGLDGWVMGIAVNETRPTASWGHGVVGTRSDIITDVALRGATGPVAISGFFDPGATWAGTPLTTSGDSRDVLVAQLSATGTPMWFTRFGGMNDEAEGGVAYDASGAVHAASRFTGAAMIGTSSVVASGPNDVALVRMEGSATGGITHAFAFPTTGADSTPGVAVAPDGTVWVSLIFSGTLSVEGSPSTSAGMSDAALVHLSWSSATGYRILGARRYGGMGNDDSTQPAVAADGRVAIAITSTMPWDPGSGIVGDGGGEDSVILLLDASGTMIDLFELDSTGPDRVLSLTFDADGNLYATARVSGSPIRVDGATLARVGSRDAVFASWDVTGALRFAHNVGGAGAVAEMNFIAPDPAHHCFYVGGDTTAPIMVGTTTVPADSYDGFIARFSY